MTYRITRKTTGLNLGTYDGATEADALNAMAREAGYSDHAAAREASQDFATEADFEFEFVEV